VIMDNDWIWDTVTIAFCVLLFYMLLFATLA